MKLCMAGCGRFFRSTMLVFMFALSGIDLWDYA
jgi:hypothetical protein